jgi:hypothetical protein
MNNDSVQVEVDKISAQFVEGGSVAPLSQTQPPRDIYSRDTTISRGQSPRDNTPPTQLSTIIG